jgi:eukaryotic-like serine/threonine-protein kinase
MGRLGFWKSDWFLGVLVTIAMIAASRTDLIESLERNCTSRGRTR